MLATLGIFFQLVYTSSLKFRFSFFSHELSWSLGLLIPVSYLIRVFMVEVQLPEIQVFWQKCWQLQPLPKLWSPPQEHNGIWNSCFKYEIIVWFLVFLQFLLCGVCGILCAKKKSGLVVSFSTASIIQKYLKALLI